MDTIRKTLNTAVLFLLLLLSFQLQSAEQVDNSGLCERNCEAMNLGCQRPCESTNKVCQGSNPTEARRNACVAAREQCIGSCNSQAAQCRARCPKSNSSQSGSDAFPLARPAALFTDIR